MALRHFIGVIALSSVVVAACAPSAPATGGATSAASTYDI